MGYKCRLNNEMESSYAYRTMEVVMVKKCGNEEQAPSTEVMLVDNDWETLKFVQENMRDFVTNLIKVKKMSENSNLKMDETANLFEQNLEPLFSIISETSRNNVLGKLSNSLKKALLLMAMDRYHCNRDSICRALGLSPEMLEQEMTLCGLKQTSSSI